MAAPIIFIGMHRSGTSLVGRLLEQLGLFVGKNKEENNEAVFFLELNNWLMAQTGARWDNPEPVAHLWSAEARSVLAASQDYVNELIRSPRLVRYLGLRRYLQEKSLDTLDFPWGWKDPRNTFTLPFWINLFPDARVIFIERHGVDVAESLRVRASQSIEKTKHKYKQGKSIAWLRPKKGGFCESPRCLTLEGGFSLWEAYQLQARDWLANRPDDEVLRVRYEELLADPVKILMQAVSFCGLTATSDEVHLTTAMVDVARAYCYRNNPQLVEFAGTRADRLNAWGYEPE